MAEVTVRGVRLAYETHGAGPPLVLIGATGMVKEAWLPGLVPKLVAGGLSVTVFDSRGVGASDAPPPPYSVEDLATDTAGLLEQLELGPCVVAGFALGAFVAEELACDRPDLVRAVALMAGARPPTAYARMLVSAGVEAAAAGLEVLPAAGVAVGLREMLPPAQLQDDGIVRAWEDALISQPPWTNPGRHGQWTAALDGLLDERGRQRWRTISPPVLVVAFELDALLPPRSAATMAAAVPHAELVVVGGASHGGPLTHAEEVATLLVDFFARHS
jgi:pimeloyl-ACP methyl ester carboxylesterase